MVSYKVTIFQSRKFQAGTSANPWICLAGEMGETGMVRLPRYCQEILFEVRKIIIYSRTYILGTLNLRSMDFTSA